MKGGNQHSVPMVDDAVSAPEGNTPDVGDDQAPGAPPDEGHGEGFRGVGEDNSREGTQIEPDTNTASVGGVLENPETQYASDAHCGIWEVSSKP